MQELGGGRYSNPRNISGLNQPRGPASPPQRAQQSPYSSMGQPPQSPGLQQGRPPSPGGQGQGRQIAAVPRHIGMQNQGGPPNGGQIPQTQFQIGAPPQQMPGLQQGRPPRPQGRGGGQRQPPQGQPPMGGGPQQWQQPQPQQQRFDPQMEEMARQMGIDPQELMQYMMQQQQTQGYPQGQQQMGPPQGPPGQDRGYVGWGGNEPAPFNAMGGSAFGQQRY